MKIGILTHQYINNYGAFLQAFALHQAVSNIFPEDEVEIINCINLKHYLINSAGWFRYYKNKENLSCWMQKIKVPHSFANARKNNLVLSKTVYTTKQVNKLKYDVIIVGSDEVWNFKDSKSNAPIKFGIGLNCPTLIAYAPSVGNTNPNEVLPNYVVDGIKKFKGLSARDDLTFELCKKLANIEPHRVLDPTFLGEFPSITEKKKMEPYILFYYCDNLPNEIKKQIFEYAKENNLKVYGAGECDKNYSDITVNLTPFEWVEMFKNAEFVFTGTFHGAVFSILNRRPFKVYLTNESRIKKVRALLNELEIKNREIDDKYHFDLDEQKNDIDYEATYKIISKKREESLLYLKKSISVV